MRYQYAFPSAILSTLAVVVPVHGDLVDRWDVGEGDQTASIQFDFLDGQTFVFDVSWTGDLTGREAFDVIADDTSGRFTFDFDFIAYSFGDFLTDVGINDAFDAGSGSPPDYVDVWHYWTAESSTDAWESSFIGFSDRMLADGARDAWVFGTNVGPSVIPAPGALGLSIIGLAAAGRRRR